MLLGDFVEQLTARLQEQGVPMSTPVEYSPVSAG
jgi:hypothetical protein